VHVVEADPHRALRVAANNLELAERRLSDSTPFRESVTELEQRLLDPGWQRFAVAVEQEFTDEGRRQMRSVCRLMSVVNPLLVQGLRLRTAYVHGGGMQVTARANGKGYDGEQDVQAALVAFRDDHGNRRAFTGAKARGRLERTLGTDGELFLALFTRPMTGDVQVRVVLADEITEVICNPEDRTEPWFYRRMWVENVYGPDGSVAQTARERLYPCVDYRPMARPKRIGSVDIAWDAPMLHVDVNRPEHWQHGVPDVYSAINWARAYKTFLEQWATLMAALSRFAWRTTAAGSKQAKTIRSALATQPSVNYATGERDDVGATAITGDGRMLEAIPKSGATIDAESGRPLAMMVAAALGLPVTMLLSDPGQTGARAVAETLDQPTELAMGDRREVWSEVEQRIARYVITESVRAPQGMLRGTIRRDRWRDVETVELTGETDMTVDIVWPDLDDTEVKDAVEAIVSANETGTIPPEVVLRLLLAALGVRQADTIIEALLDEDGRFLWPSVKPGALPDLADDEPPPDEEPEVNEPGEVDEGEAS
jgi:hypothetical protein